MATIKQIKDTEGNVHDILSTIGYGTCSTAAATAAKVVTISDTSWTLKVGSVIGIKFTYTNSAGSLATPVTLNVNNTGAKNIWYNSTVCASTDSNICGYKDRVIYYMYDGTYWVWMNSGALDGNTIPCIQIESVAIAAEKVGTCTNYSLLANSYAHANVRYSNTKKSALTLNVNSKGAKRIYINGTASSSSNYTLPAGTYIIYYDGTNYHFRTDGALPGKILNAINDENGDNIMSTYTRLSDFDSFTSYAEETYTKSMLSVTYSKLVNLRDNGKLIPGQQYRITDYITTTVQEDTESAGHQFDIIVTANSNNTLSEIAGACLHVGDTYFSENGANLSAWQIWYCLDNDVDRFEWADGTNGKGVIYRMIDEWGNDCPYDFKNIKFTKPIISETDTPDSNLYYTFCSYDGNSSNIKDASIIGNNYNVYNNVIKPSLFIIKKPKSFYSLNRILFIGNYFNSNKFGSGCYNNTFGDNCVNNTFGTDCHKNTFGNGCYGNTFGTDCYLNTFGDECKYNTFGTDCHKNTFGTDCVSNTFGIGCDSNTFGNDCSYNTFGNLCGLSKVDGKTYNGNEFMEGCKYNLFGDYCRANKFSKNCINNTFGNNCYSNIFGTLNSNNNEFYSNSGSCSRNKFGTNCYNNKLSNSCQNNSFDIDCHDNEFGESCTYNKFDTLCAVIKFGRNCSYNTLGNGCIHIKFGSSRELKSYYRRIIIDNGNQYIFLNCKTSTGTGSYYQNVRIGLCVNNTSTYKTISDGNKNQTFETYYKPSESQTILI